MAEYSRLASGKVLSAGSTGNTAVILPFVPNFIEITNTTEITAASGGVTRAWWMTDMGQGAAAYITTGSGPADGSNFISAATGGGFATFQGGIALQYGPTLAIASITKHATAPVVTTTGNHGLVSGNVVVFQNLYESSTTGMIQLCNVPFVVTVTAPTTFTIAFDNNVSGYTAISGSPTTPTPTVKQVLYPQLYVPGTAFIAAITTGSTTTISTTAPSNFVVGQEIAFRVPSVWGTIQLNSLPNILIPGSPTYGFVTSVTNSTTFVCSINSTGYTAFTTNVPFATAAAGGFTFAQVVAVGDANSGSLLTNFQSPAFYNGFGTGLVNSINGPALAGAYCNNTSQGFLIGPTIAGTAADVIYWRAYMHDINY